MVSHVIPRPTALSRRVTRTGLLAATLAAWLAGAAAPTEAQQARSLRIGTGGNLAPGANEAKEKAASASLRALIKEETGLENEIVRHRNWQELADRMAAGQVHIGVFLGHEFAWAQEKYPDLKPLALAVRSHRYPQVHVVTRQDSPAADLAALQGKALSLPNGNGFPRLFLERQTQAAGKAPEDFFSKVATPDNLEDALDDVVDGLVQAAVVDRAGLEAYRRRKPGRFKQLKEIAHSEPVLPAVIAHYDAVLDNATLQRFRDGLINANRKEKGQTLLTLFRLTGFESVPPDFDRVAIEMRKAYPFQEGGK